MWPDSSPSVSLHVFWPVVRENIERMKPSLHRDLNETRSSLQDKQQFVSYCCRKRKPNDTKQVKPSITFVPGRWISLTASRPFVRGLLLCCKWRKEGIQMEKCLDAELLKLQLGRASERASVDVKRQTNCQRINLDKRERALKCLK